MPLYNGCSGPSELIDQGLIVRALRAGAPQLSAHSLPADAPPVFLLDWLRASQPRPLRTGMLDNRWRVLLEDLPSEKILHRRGISRVVLVQRQQIAPHDDLAVILRCWQEARIPLEVKYLSVPGPPRPLIVPSIPWYRRLWHRLLSKRGPQDGYGYVVREPTHG